MPERFGRATAIGIIGASAIGLSLLSGPAQAASTASISGVVTSAATGQPLRDVTVYESPTGSPDPEYPTPSAMTDASGHYAFTGLAAGTYRIAYAARPGSVFATQWWQSAFDPNHATPVTVGDGATVTGIDAALQSATASISGHLTSPAGYDPTRISVRLFNADDPAYTAAYGSVSADGTYAVRALPAGEYKLLFTSQVGDLTNTFAGGTTDFTAATVVPVGSGQTATGPDVTLDAGASISGRITGGVIAQGYGLAHAYRLTASGGPENSYSDRKVAIAKDGTFTVTGLNPGAYKLAYMGVSYGDCARWPTIPGQPTLKYTPRRFWWNDQSNPQSAAPITVTEHQHVTGINDNLDVLAGRSTRASISGTPVVGQTLHVNPGAWPAGTPLRYVWIAGNGFIIKGATGSSFTVQQAQTYETISVEVYGQTGGLDPGCTSEWDQVAPLPTLLVPFTSAPSIAGTRAVGSALTIGPGTWASGTKFSYAWYANGVYIPGTSGHRTFTPTLAQKGKTLTVRVTGSNAGYATASRTSGRTAKIAQTSAPTISGARRIGYTLTAHAGTWTPGTHLTYKWYSDETDYIPGSTGHATLKLTGAVYDRQIRVSVTGSLPGYQTITRFSGRTISIR